SFSLPLSPLYSFDASSPTQIYTLSLHDALPISFYLPILTARDATNSGEGDYFYWFRAHASRPTPHRLWTSTLTFEIRHRSRFSSGRTVGGCEFPAVSRTQSRASRLRADIRD